MRPKNAQRRDQTKWSFRPLTRRGPEQSLAAGRSRQRLRRPAFLVLFPKEGRKRGLEVERPEVEGSDGTPDGNLKPPRAGHVVPYGIPEPCCNAPAVDPSHIYGLCLFNPASRTPTGLTMSLRSDQEWMIEFWMFFDLCKRGKRDDVEQVYIAIQASLAYQVKAVDVGPLLAKIRPPRYRGLDDGYDPAIGMSGLAYFNWIYDLELIDQGNTDYHTYLFRRKHDKRKVEVTLKTTLEPKSVRAKEDYEEQLRKLEKWREKLLVTKRYGATAEFLFGP